MIELLLYVSKNHIEQAVLYNFVSRPIFCFFRHIFEKEYNKIYKAISSIAFFTYEDNMQEKVYYLHNTSIARKVQTLISIHGSDAKKIQECI